MKKGMDIGTKTTGTNRQFGYSSRIRRHNAQMAEHDTYSRNEFLRVLADCHQNLGIEGRAESPRKDLNENGEEVKEKKAKVDWESLSCPKCDFQVKNTRKLLEHLVESHGKPQDKIWFKDFNVTGKEIKKMLDEAIEAQSSCSYIKKKFENSNDFLICPTDSSLSPFLLMRHLQVFLKEIPPNISEGIAVKLQIQGADMTYTIIFALQKVERRRRRVKNALITKRRNKRLKELELRCDRAWVTQNDVVFKKNRTAEEHRALALSFNLPITCTHDEIVKKVNEMKRKYDEIKSCFSNVYAVTIKSNGQIMSAEERKLISSLTSTFMVPVSGKRKTTFKNPSELLMKKKKE
uniref:C2H2-type domain-containing protein n=1 Tax=Caenorhabditis japonica TaxID=281687 RepID=A0A8R1HGS2_CAEJA